MSAFMAFQEFLAATSAAVYAEYAARPGVRVISAREFAEMRAYVLRLYVDAQVAGSMFVDHQVFDCVIRPGVDPAGLVFTDRGCPDGTIPMRRITLEELTRFPTLRAFLGKAPGGEVSLPD